MRSKSELERSKTDAEATSEITDKEYNEAYNGDWWVESVTD